VLQRSAKEVRKTEEGEQTKRASSRCRTRLRALTMQDRCQRGHP